MRRHARQFNYRGFVALADLMFAVSVGLLLLDPRVIQAAPPPEVPAPPPVVMPDPGPPAASAAESSARALKLRSELQRAMAMLDELEARMPRIERQSQQVLRSE